MTRLLYHNPQCARCPASRSCAFRSILDVTITLGRGSFHAPSCPNRFLSRGWDTPTSTFPFPLFTLLVHRCVPIAYTGVNCRDRHLCIRTRQISGQFPFRTIPTFAAAGKLLLVRQENRRVAASTVFSNHGKGLPRSNIRWPTGHSEGTATGGAHGNRRGRNPPRHFNGEPFAKRHPHRMSNGARQNCRAPFMYVF